MFLHVPCMSTFLFLEKLLTDLAQMVKQLLLST